MTVLWAIEEWTGHKQPTNRMKTIQKFGYLAMALVAVAFVLAFTGCATIETTVTSPDGTVTVTKSSAPDAASVAALSTTAQAFAPRVVVVNPAK